MIRACLIGTLIVTLFSSFAGAKRRGRNRQIQNGPTSYAFFEMMKTQKKDPYYQFLRYPIFKGTSEYKFDAINNFLKTQIENAWICSTPTEKSHISVNSKMLLFSPKFASMKVSIEDGCSGSEKKNIEKGINFSLVTGKVYSELDFINETQRSEFDRLYLEKIKESASGECIKEFSEKVENANYEFFITKEQIIVTRNSANANIDCDYDAEFSVNELKTFKTDGASISL